MARHEEKVALKADVIQSLREAIKKYGLEAAPKIVREQYPDVPKPTWYRWLKEVSASPLEVAVDAATKVAKSLPASPSPSYVADRPVESRLNFDILAKVERLYADAELLREHAIRRVKNESGDAVESIKIPTFFAQSISLRGSVLEMAVKTIQQVYDLRRMQDFYDAILEEIRQESPEIAMRIADRLARLNAERGMTIDARI